MDGDIFNCLNALESQFSLPQISLEMATVEKLLHIPEDSVPCKIRFKRGCATHPRSITERASDLGCFDTSDLLNGLWVVVVGDSQARLVARSLLSLVLDSRPLKTVNKDLFKRHNGCQIVVGEIGMRLDFIWAERSRKASAVTL
ncbi:hypothetical protein ACFX13_028627 [Malus domestica]